MLENGTHPSEAWTSEVLLLPMHHHHQYVCDYSHTQKKVDLLHTHTHTHTHTISFKNYRSCYEGVGDLTRNTEYQILNSTGISSLKWPGHNGMYVFAVTIVARDYRYKSKTTSEKFQCTLHAILLAVFVT